MNCSSPEYLSKYTRNRLCSASATLFQSRSLNTLGVSGSFVASNRPNRNAICFAGDHRVGRGRPFSNRHRRTTLTVEQSPNNILNCRNFPFNGVKQPLLLVFLRRHCLLLNTGDRGPLSPHYRTTHPIRCTQSQCNEKALWAPARSLGACPLSVSPRGGKGLALCPKGWRVSMGFGGCEGAPHLNLLPLGEEVRPPSPTHA